MRRTTLLSAASVVVYASASTAQAPPGAGDARASFTRAVTLYADGNYEAALVEFHRAHALSGNPNLFYNLGAVYESLGRFVEAGGRAHGLPHGRMSRPPWRRARPSSTPASRAFASASAPCG